MVSGRIGLAATLVLAAALTLVCCSPALGDDGLSSRFPPEPLSPWAGVEREVEFLVARGELPCEAGSFRPVDRGMLAQWLLEGYTRGIGGQVEGARGTEGGARTHLRPGRRGPSRQRLTELVRWDHQQWRTPAPGDKPRAGALARFAAADRLLLLAPYVRFMPRLRTDERIDWTDSTRVGFRAIFYAGRSLVINSGFYAAEIDHARSFADPLVEDTDVVLHADELTLSARLGGLRLRLGRDRHHWGPGVGGSLLLSETAAAFDFVEYQLRLGRRFRFLALTGETSAAAESPGACGVRGEPGSAADPNPGRHRYISAHRLLWTITPEFSLGLSEGARYQADSPSILYLGGFVPYTLVERLQMQDEPSDSTENYLRNNVLWSLDAVWRPRPGWLLYGEVLADDIATQTSKAPSRGAYRLGVTWAPQHAGRDWTLGLQYTRVSNYTYSVYYQDLCQCDWDHQRRSLGYPGGPDVEEFLLRAGVAASPRWSVRGWVRYIRRGHGTIGQPWKPESTGCDPAADGDCGDADAWSLPADMLAVWRNGVAIDYRAGPVVWGGASIERLAADREAFACAESCGRPRPVERREIVLRFYLSAGI